MDSRVAEEGVVMHTELDGWERCSAGSVAGKAGKHLGVQSV